MSNVLQAISKFSAAEEFFEFFGIAYEPSVIHVNRLHILKRFNQYLRVTPNLEGMSGEEQHPAIRSLLLRAYEDFIRSTPAEEKVFKVFQDTNGTQHVGIDNLRGSMRARGV